MLTTFVPGNSWIHKVPAQIKVSVLLLFSISLTLQTHLIFLLILTGTVLVVTLTARKVGRLALMGLKPFLPVLFLLCIFQLYFSDLQATLTTFFRTVGILLLANLVSLTTNTLFFLRSGRSSRPEMSYENLKYVARIALALMLRFIPLLLAQWSNHQYAWAARSSRPAGVRLVPPFINAALVRAEFVAEALQAKRSIRSARTQIVTIPSNPQ